MAAERGSSGPDGYWSSELPPSRGQVRAIAEGLLELMGEGFPASRLEATILLARIEQVKGEQQLAEVGRVLAF